MALASTAGWLESTCSTARAASSKIDAVDVEHRGARADHRAQRAARRLRRVAIWQDHDVGAAEDRAGLVLREEVGDQPHLVLQAETDHLPTALSR